MEGSSSCYRYQKSTSRQAVFAYQGDGDLASIGTAEIAHAAHRGEK